MSSDLTVVSQANHARRGIHGERRKHDLYKNFRTPRNFGGGEFRGAMPSTGGPVTTRGVVAKATACEDTSYYNEYLLTQQTCFLSQR